MPEFSFRVAITFYLTNMSFVCLLLQAVYVNERDNFY
jgi:hypothetical protein